MSIQQGGLPDNALRWHRNHDDLVVEHHRVSRRGFAAHVGERAGRYQAINVVCFQHILKVGSSADERAEAALVDNVVAVADVESRMKRVTGVTRVS